MKCLEVTYVKLSAMCAYSYNRGSLPHLAAEEINSKTNIHTVIDEHTLCAQTLMNQPLIDTLVVLVNIVAIIVSYNRFSPGQWDNPHPCSPDVDLLENDLTPANSLWFVLGSFLQQGMCV